MGEYLRKFEVPRSSARPGLYFIFGPNARHLRGEAESPSDGCGIVRSLQGQNSADREASR
jgi:hypothetical protein